MEIDVIEEENLSGNRSNKVNGGEIVIQCHSISPSLNIERNTCPHDEQSPRGTKDVMYLYM